MINCFRKQIHKYNDPSLFSPEVNTALTCTQRLKRGYQILQILRISWISQYTEVKSKNTPKKSKDLQGFHQYIPEYSENIK